MSAAPEAPAALTQDEIAAIARAAAPYARKRAACIDAMKIVQRRRGWVSDEQLRGIAALLDMSVDDLDAVATFYNLIYRRPVGRHVLHVCDSVSCWLMGEPALTSRLRERLGVEQGGTTADGRFTLLPIQCLGACDRAPALLVDRELHVEVSPERVEELLARYE